MSDPGFTFYADNFLGGTMFMTDAQVGKYVRCLCAQKLNGHLSLDELSSIAKEEKKVLEKFKKDSDGLYFNERLQKEIDKRIHHSELQRDRINKRWDKHDTAVLPGNKSGNTCMNTGIGIEIGIKNENELFDQFWKAYPKKVGKLDAKKAWDKIKAPTETLKIIMVNLEWQIKSEQWTKEGGKYIPHPSKYLNAGRWLDEQKLVSGITKRTQTADPTKYLESLRNGTAP
jgi:hypothetical protein